MTRTPAYAVIASTKSSSNAPWKSRPNGDGRGTPGSLSEVWVRELKDGSRAVGLFNRGEQAAQITLDLNDAKLSGTWTARDLWQHKDLGNIDAKITQQVPQHGSVLLKLNRTAP